MMMMLLWRAKAAELRGDDGAELWQHWSNGRLISSSKT